MRSVWLTLSLLLVVPACVLACSEVISWVPPYAIEEAKAAVLADLGACPPSAVLSRVGLQFWAPTLTGGVRYVDHEWTVPTDGDVAWWRDWCRAHGVDCLLTVYNNVGFWDWDLARAAFDTHMAAFVAALVAEMERLDLDGIDLDLEGIGALDGDRAAFGRFVAALSAELRLRGKVLTVDSFHYIWNGPNHSWWPDWVGLVDGIHSMGYDDLFEGGSGYQRYSFQLAAGVMAGHPDWMVAMGMPAWLGSWGVSAGRGTSALAHVEECRFDLASPVGVAIWDLQLAQWRDPALWCALADLRMAGSGPCAGPALWRNAEVTALSPVTPERRLVLPLDAGDLYRASFGSGSELVEPGGPLVFYVVDGPVELRLTRAGAGLVRFEF